MLRKCLAETFGTFCLVFAGTGAIVMNDVSGGKITHVGIALTFGLIVTAMIYALGDISGCHLNPSVSLGLWLSGRFTGSSLLPYLLAQLIGATLGSVTLRLLFPEHPTLGGTIPSGPDGQSFVLEFLLTLILMFVILAATCGRPEKVALAGIVIGGVIALEALFAGPICGASMNPARSFAPAIISGRLDSLWIYLLAPTLGSAVGVLCWWCLKEPSLSKECPS